MDFNEAIDILFDCLIKVMIKNEYDTLSLDQLMEIKHDIKKHKLTSGSVDLTK